MSKHFVQYIPVTHLMSRHRIPSFSDIALDGKSAELYPFANSLTITRDDFANFLHCDKDEIETAFGLWWCGIMKNGHYHVDPTVDHEQVKGGAFVWGEFGYGVDFERQVCLCL